MHNGVFKPSAGEDGKLVSIRAFYRLAYTATDGARVGSRLHPRAAASFAKNVARQPDCAAIAMKPSEFLVHMEAHQVTVWVDSSQYGQGQHKTPSFRARMQSEHRVVR